MRLSGRSLRWLLLVLLILATSAPSAAQDANTTELIRRAESGDATAQYQLGVVYDNGLGVPKDTTKAMFWWRKAADQGNVDAQAHVVAEPSEHKISAGYAPPPPPPPSASSSSQQHHCWPGADNYWCRGERGTPTIPYDYSKDQTWTDPATGLMWAKDTDSGEDNDSIDVNWNQARDYCSKLRLAGYSNWRLPTLRELASIYDQSQNGNVKGGIKIPRWRPVGVEAAILEWLRGRPQTARHVQYRLGVLTSCVGRNPPIHFSSVDSYGRCVYANRGYVLPGIKRSVGT